MRNLLEQAETDCIIGQLLTMPHGGSQDHADDLRTPCQLHGIICTTLPILKITKLRLADEQPYAELTCIGRSRLTSPLTRSSDGAHAFATAEPLTDDIGAAQTTGSNLSSLPLRKRYNSCRELSARAQLARSGLSAGGQQVVNAFDLPLEELLKQREHALCDALMGACDNELRLHTAAAERSRECGLLSYAVASLLPPERRARALNMREADERFEFAARALEELEQRLVAELTLQEWDETR